MLTLADVLEALTGTRPQDASMILSEAGVDSRQVIPAGMFVVVKGENVDRHVYVENAFRAGANLALVERDLSPQFLTIDLRSGRLPENFVAPKQPFCILVNDALKAMQDVARFWRSKLNVNVIGITGSIGKSTTKELIAEVLSRRYRTLKSLGNQNNEIGVPMTLLRLGSGYERAIIEMGFYVPGEIQFLCEMALPRVGVITNVGPVHAARAGSVEAIAEGKAELVRALPADGTAILNFDDPLVRDMAHKTSARVFYYGISPEADLWADQIEGRGLEGILCRLHYQNEMLYLRVPLIGRHSVHTVLRAAAVGLVEGLTWTEIIEGLQQGRTQLRLVAVRSRSGALLLDDSYNASPESTLAALNLLGEMEGRKIAVLGDMLELGSYEKIGHEKVGARAAEVCDRLVAIGERSKITVEAALQAGMPASAITWLESTPAAAEYLADKLTASDVVLIKGSLGMRMSVIVTALEIPA